MIYSRLYFKNQFKIPMFVAVLFIALISLFFIHLMTMNVSIPSKAAKKTVRRIEITNPAPNQMSIFWQTDTKEIGWVLYGEKENQLIKTALDERDLQLKKNSYFNHYVILRNLKANQRYFFKLVINNQLITNSNNTPFVFQTPSISTNFNGRNPAYGKVIKNNETPLENAIVLLKIDKMYALSTLTKSTGEWLIPLNKFYERETNREKNPLDTEPVSLEIWDEDGQASNIKTTLSKLSPLPQTVIMGKDFNFIEEENVLSATTVLDNNNIYKEISIIYPLENALVNSGKPLIKGLALPNTEVIITVNSETIYTGKVIANKKGEWQFNLPGNLSWGDHTVTIITTDRQGNQVTIKRKFTVTKEGEQVLGSATPEAILTPTSVIFTPTPTSQLRPTSIYSITPTTPVSGGNLTVPLVGATSFIILGLGLLLVF